MTDNSTLSPIVKEPYLKKSKSRCSLNTQAEKGEAPMEMNIMKMKRQWK
ncbi:hypothetical protein BSP18_064 [Bacillus phage BSP18]|nr:hypothetical protein BSP18_064 [Bacillus phage BSP18]